MCGLTRRDAAAVSKRIVSGKYTNTEIARYRALKLEARASAIARTETANAFAEGNKEAYRKAHPKAKS